MLCYCGNRIYRKRNSGFNPKIIMVRRIFAVIFLLLVFPSLSFAGKLIDVSPEGYILYLPGKLSAENKAPVLVCLPGFGMSAKSEMNNWVFPAETNGFIAVVLEIDYNKIRSEEDIKNLCKRITGIVRNICEKYPGNGKKIYLSGTSAGGMTSITLGLMFPEKFPVIGVVSGGRFGFNTRANLKNAGKCAFYMAHGAKDESIPISEFHVVRKELEKYSAKVKYEVFPDNAHVLPSRAYKDVLSWMAARQEVTAE